jgi:translation initiation factor IF-3
LNNNYKPNFNQSNNKTTPTNSTPGQNNFQKNNNQRTFGRRPPVKVQEHRINEGIQSPQVRVVGENIEPGVYDTHKAIAMARQMEVDLVEVSPNAVPPVCRLIDYNKFLYERKKKEKEAKAASKAQQMKEIRFTPNTDDHDFNFKIKHSINFLQEGNKVRAYVQFKGRAIAYAQRGELLLLKFAQALEEYGVPEQLPKLDGKKMFISITPKKKK